MLTLVHTFARETPNARCGALGRTGLGERYSSILVWNAIRDAFCKLGTVTACYLEYMVSFYPLPPHRMLGDVATMWRHMLMSPDEVTSPCALTRQSPAGASSTWAFSPISLGPRENLRNAFRG